MVVNDCDVDLVCLSMNALFVKCFSRLLLVRDSVYFSNFGDHLWISTYLSVFLKFDLKFSDSSNASLM